jgi:hypothetical protein
MRVRFPPPGPPIEQDPKHTITTRVTAAASRCDSTSPGRVGHYSLLCRSYGELGQGLRLTPLDSQCTRAIISSICQILQGGCYAETIQPPDFVTPLV